MMRLWSGIAGVAIGAALLLGQSAPANMLLVPPPAGAPSYTGPGDSVSGATAWYGLRAYSAAKRGNAAINVCNVSDVVCADMSTDATTGALVVTTIGGSDCGSVNCTVKIIYDQTGNGFNLSQATIASRPLLKLSCLGSLPCLNFSAGGLFNSSTTSISQPWSISAVIERTGQFSSGYLISSTGSYEGLASGGGSADNVQLYGSNTLQATATDNVSHAVQALANGASGVINVDGTETTGNTGSNAFENAGWYLGADSFGDNLRGYIAEMGIWGAGFSSGQRTSLCHNQHTYWATATSC